MIYSVSRLNEPKRGEAKYKFDFRSKFILPWRNFRSKFILPWRNFRSKCILRFDFLNITVVQILRHFDVGWVGA